MSPRRVSIGQDEATAVTNADGQLTGIHWHVTGELHEVWNGQHTIEDGDIEITALDPERPLVFIRPKQEGELTRADCFSPYPRAFPDSPPS